MSKHALRERADDKAYIEWLEKELFGATPPPPPPIIPPRDGDDGDGDGDGQPPRPRQPRHRREPRGITVRLRTLIAAVTPLLAAGLAIGWVI